MITVLEYKQGVSGDLKELISERLGLRGIFFINYGNSILSRRDTEVDILLNVPEAVSRTAGKLTMLKVLGDNEAWEKVYKSPLRNFVRSMVVQKPLNHKGGRSVKIINPLTPKAPKGTYWEEYVKCDQEWRVDVVDTRTSARLKVGGRGEIRNRRHGWTFAYPDKAASSEVRQAAIAAVKALGLDFGAVDVGERKGKIPVVYEVNTAPRLTSPTITEWYADKMVKLIQGRMK